MRRAWVQIHLWLGLTLGVVGIFIGITGSLLLYDRAIDTRLNPQRYAVTGSRVSLTYAEYVAGIAQALGGGARVVNLRLPEEEGMPIVALARPREGATFYRVYVDPPTGRVLDAAAGGGFIGWLHRFHENLTLREYSGREIVGLVGFAMMISSLSGLYLWWPARGRLGEALGARPGLARSRNLHYLFGFYGSLILALLSFTGIWLAYPDAGRAVVAGFSPVSPLARTIEAAQSRGKPIPPDTAVSAAQALYPQARVTGLGIPAGPRGVYRVNLQDAGGAIAVFLDPATAGVLRSIDSSSRSAGDRFLTAQRQLHTGEAFGAARIVLFAGGLLPAILAVTGTMMWLRQRRRHRATSLQPQTKNLENATAARGVRR
jgi:uncharacterized iron-regulated membrane protein